MARQDVTPFDSAQFSYDDRRLIELIQTEYLIPPSTKPYHLPKGIEDPSQGQTAEIIKILGKKKNGFFIECGAFDGVISSNTLFFERWLGWEGVLIEANLLNVISILEKRRKAWLVPACLNIINDSSKVLFHSMQDIGHIVTNKTITEREDEEVLCLPLYSILLALNRTKIDYFSLDVEGLELQILKTIPWGKVNITTLSVECRNVLDKEELRGFMESLGYRVYSIFGEIPDYAALTNDFIFYHPLLLHGN